MLTLVAGLGVGQAAADDNTTHQEMAAAVGNPVNLTSGFYVDPNSNPARWANEHPGTTANTIRANIASKPMARWFGNWNTDLWTDVNNFVSAADAADKLPVLVAYNIPGRDCHGHSSGGAGSPEAYRSWIATFAAAIGSRPAVVIVEPDALAQLDCMPADQQSTRTSLIYYATQQFTQKATNTWVYLDGGNAKWINANTMADRLNAAGVRNVRGFSVNVSNFYTTRESTDYGNAVNARLSAQHGYSSKYIVDTSRNANGAWDDGNSSTTEDWCNPPGRKLGATSQVSTSGAEMLLWVKVPGDSDGDCNLGKGTRAGDFVPDLALHLINGN
ncbi:glycoside hydrolase family 6 protein [Goodfellowiella coeruleoviolacea]|nr:glycoside hydrolase family 6 protein [Goodfellowiella coeruleoviolacea]